MNNLPNVVSFSGGLSSGKMLRDLMLKYPDFRSRFISVFENTGKEDDETLEFVHKFETYYKVPIIWLEYQRVDAMEVPVSLVKEGKTQTFLMERQEKGEMTHWWKVVDYETAARMSDKRTPFDDLLEWANVLPNVVNRMCSVQLKVRTRDRYLYAQGIREFNSFIGIRADESHRVAEILANIGDFEKPQFPMVDAGITRADVNDHWCGEPFTLNIPNSRGNCGGCFLKARHKRIAFARHNPVAAKWWSGWEGKRTRTTDGDGGRFDRRKGNLWEALIADAANPDLVLDFDEPDVPCSCAIGGYRQSNTDEHAA